jgi:hypothetical protein
MITHLCYVIDRWNVLAVLTVNTDLEGLHQICLHCFFMVELFILGCRYEFGPWFSLLSWNFLFISFHYFASATSKDIKLCGALLGWINNLVQCEIQSCKTIKAWLHLTVHN